MSAGTTGCTLSTSSVTIYAGSSSTYIYYRDTTTESLTLSAADSGASLTTGTLSVQNKAVSLVWGGVTHVASSTCSGAITITAQDPSNAAHNLQSTTTISSGSSSTTLYFKDATTESLTFSASAPGCSTGTWSFTMP